MNLFSQPTSICDLEINDSEGPMLKVALFPVSKAALLAVGGGNNSHVSCIVKRKEVLLALPPTESGPFAPELVVILLKQGQEQERFTLGACASNDVMLSSPAEIQNDCVWINVIHVQLYPDGMTGVVVHNSSKVTFSGFPLDTLEVSSVLLGEGMLVGQGAWQFEFGKGLDFQMMVNGGVGSESVSNKLIVEVCEGSADLRRCKSNAGSNIIYKKKKGKKGQGKQALANGFNECFCRKTEVELSGDSTNPETVSLSEDASTPIILATSGNVSSAGNAHTDGIVVTPADGDTRCMNKIDSKRVDDNIIPIVGASKALAGGFVIEREVYRQTTDILGTVKVSLGRRGAEIRAIKQYQVPFRKLAADTWRNEMKVLRGLDHPGIARLLDYNVRNLRLDLDWGGIALSTYVNKDQMCTMPEEDWRQVWADASGALEYPHGQEVVHLDIKPHNILVWLDGRAKICDFGYSVCNVLAGMSLSQGSGTLSYIPPEYILSERGRPGDIWALGITMLFASGFTKLPMERWNIANAKEVETEERQHFNRWMKAILAMSKTLPISMGLLRKMLDYNPSKRIIAEELTIALRESSMIGSRRLKLIEV